jgi:hypothetical protein
MAIKHLIRDRGNSVKEVSLTPIKAIRLFCNECMGFQVQEIKDCTDTKCSLFPYRMGSNISCSRAVKNNLKSTLAA